MGGNLAAAVNIHIAGRESRDHCISDSDEFKNFVYSADSDNGESFPYAPFSPDDFVFDEFTFSVDGSDS